MSHVDEPHRENPLPISPDHEQGTDDRELVRRIRLGDEAAFEAMLDRYGRVLYRLVYDVVLSKAVADEVLQDIFFSLWERRAVWDLQGQLKSYLYRVARNRALNYVKRERIERRWRDWWTGSSPAPEVAPAAERQVVRDELIRALARAVDRLPERARAAYRLRWEHHLTNSEIAEVMGISVKGVERHMRRALSELRDALADFAP